jgi:glycosyltransferase involved in cell wall biosynthesis
MTGLPVPLITAVIPTRMRSGLVVRAVRSALGQTYPNVEVVVVVDGPDTATVGALESLAESRLRVIALTENVGGSKARNIGVREARGSWIALLDDDDEWFPEKLAKQMATVANETAPHRLVTCRRLERQPGEPDKLAPRRTLREGEDVSEYLFYSEDSNRHTSGPQSSGYLGTKMLFQDVPFSEGLKCHQDWDWYLRAMCKAATVAVAMDEPLYIMYVEPARPRVTDVARWELSLDWVESRKHLFTQRAFISFLINECMYRCEETSNRTRIFRILFAVCRRSGRLRTRDLIAAVKWYTFRPSVRLRLVGSYRQLRASLNGAAAGSRALEVPPTKHEVHG